MDGPSNGDGGPRTPQQASAQKRLQQTQAQVDEVVGIMRMNVEKVIERDQKLSELDDRADALQQGASQFEQQAGKLKRKYWWKNLKMMIIMGIIALIIIIIIAVSIFGGSSGSGSKDSSGTEVHDHAVTSSAPLAVTTASNAYQMDYATAERYVIVALLGDSMQNVTKESSERGSTVLTNYQLKSTTITPLVLVDEDTNSSDRIKSRRKNLNEDVETDYDNLPESLRASVNVLDPPRYEYRKGQS